MNLVEKQQMFSFLVAKLIFEIYSHDNLRVTVGECWRSPKEAHRLGFDQSLHQLRLAIDLNLFKDGKYTSRSSDYKPIGEIWKSFSSPEVTCCWGGDFVDEHGESVPDGNHFSIEHNGVK